MANSNEEEAGNAAFDLVYSAQEDLQELLDSGGEKDEDPETSLAAIKNAGQVLFDAIGNLSLADFEEEFKESEEDVEAEAVDSIFN